MTTSAKTTIHDAATGESIEHDDESGFEMVDPLDKIREGDELMDFKSRRWHEARESEIGAMAIGLYVRRKRS